MKILGIFAFKDTSYDQSKKNRDIYRCDFLRCGAPIDHFHQPYPEDV
jgi:hypothetical protein